MYYPLVNERVRMSNRADEFMVFSINHNACVANLHLLTDPKAIEIGVPFRLLFAVCGLAQAPAVACSREGLFAANQEMLRSSREIIDRGLAIRAGHQVSFSKNSEAIRISRLLIEASDRVIARARTLDCDETGDGSNAEPVR